jgi:hypothetical protein
MTSGEFMEILAGQKQNGWFNQDWAISRVLENLNYYEAMTLVPFETLADHWESVKSRIFAQSIKDGYEFVLYRHALSIAG